MSKLSSASTVMLSAEPTTAQRLSKTFGMTENYSRGLQIMLLGR